jgi:hypothetical protein
MAMATSAPSHQRLDGTCAAATVSRLGRLLRGRLPPEGRQSRQDGPAGWQRLAHPVPGYTTVDGLPVPVVAVRRHSASAQLQVVRGYLTTLGSPDGPPDPDRHLIPAASFTPHPRRGLTIGDERLQYNTLANSTRCRACGKDDLGFGFVSSAIPVEGPDRAPAPNRSLCEACAERQARAPDEAV